MSEGKSFFKTSTQSTLRQWRSTPTYFFLVWRWGTWLFALVSLLADSRPLEPHVGSTMSICLVISFVYTTFVTLYAPVSHLLLSQLSQRKTSALTKSLGRKHRVPKDDHPQLSGAKEQAHILQPLLETRHTSLNIAIYCLDVIICGLLTYFTAVNQGGAPFGASSPFYRYGLSSVLVAGFAYGYGGGLLAALGYNLFILFGAFVFPPGQSLHYETMYRSFDLIRSLIDAPLVALLAALIAGQLNKAIQSKHREQDHARRERALRRVSETLVTGISDRVQLLSSSLKAIRQGGHFDRVVLALVRQDNGEAPRPDFETYVETTVSGTVYPEVSEELMTQVVQTRQGYASFDLSPEKQHSFRYGLARLYQPFFKENQIALVIGAESMRYTPFEERQADFLATVGPQLVVALENIYLTEKTAALATIAERARIAREIHDGVTQLLYILRLKSETCLELVERLTASTEDGGSSLAPICQDLKMLVKISRQALWETRQFLSLIGPSSSDDATLTQMLTSLVREFEAISGLPVRLEVEGREALFNHAQQSHSVQVGKAIFRITQEALTNAYKHAEASQLEVFLRHQPERITVEISDNGRGLPLSTPSPGTIYSFGRGLQGMHERAKELDGTLELVAKTAGGTCVVASIPLEL